MLSGQYGLFASLFLTVTVLSFTQEKRGVMNSAGHQLLLNCLETLQRALKGKGRNASNGCYIPHHHMFSFYDGSKSRCTLDSSVCDSTTDLKERQMMLMFSYLMCFDMHGQCPHWPR